MAGESEIGKPEGAKPRPKSQAGFRLRTLHLFLLIPWIAVVVAARQPVKDNSFLWHVRAGTLQLDAGEVLRTDPFSFTFGGQPWRTQSWLADLLYGILERGLGHDLGWVGWLNIAVVGLTLALVGFLVMRRTGSVATTAITLFLLGWLVIPYVNPRPVVFSFLLLAMLMVVRQTGQRWSIPLILWVWAAVHGSFVIGIGLLVLDALANRDRRAWRTIGLSTVAVSLTAHGLAIWQILIQFAGVRSALRLITEWQPPNLTGLATIPYALFILAILVGLGRGTIPVKELWMVAPFLLFGLTSGRAVMVAALVLAPYVGMALAEPVSARGLDAARRGGPPPLVVALVAVGIVLLPFLLSADLDRMDRSRFPLTAAGFLEPVPTFHTDVDGGYLIFETWPEHKVFTDDRAELYGGDFFRAFVDARGAVPGWEKLMEEWSVEQVLIRSETPLAGVLEDHPEWSLAYRDADYVIFRRRG